MDEKRRAVRWKVALPVRYLGVTRHAEGVCRLENLSVMGARVSMVERHLAGDRLHMMLEIPDNRHSRLCLEGDVVWQEETNGSHEEYSYVTGITFKNIGDFQKKTLMDYVNRYYPEEFRQHWWDDMPQGLSQKQNINNLK